MIDLHIHSKDCSDGRMSLEQIFNIAYLRGIKVISITDHDSIGCQKRAKELAQLYKMHYITGVELNISFRFSASKAISLDILGYQFDIHNRSLIEKLKELREYRKRRAEMILKKVNMELEKDGISPFTYKDIHEIEKKAEGTLGRPHIADYMIEKGIIKTRKEAFERYLVKCDVPKMPLSLEEASSLIREAGGKAILAHPNDPRGTSLYSVTDSLPEQFKIIEENMLSYLDGVECWHSTHDSISTNEYMQFAKRYGLMVTGGSDCHQQPVIMGSIKIPLVVAEQFGIHLAKEVLKFGPVN